jgi:hypothetical protein
MCPAPVRTSGGAATRRSPALTGLRGDGSRVSPSPGTSCDVPGRGAGPAPGNLARSESAPGTWWRGIRRLTALPGRERGRPATSGRCRACGPASRTLSGSMSWTSSAPCSAAGWRSCCCRNPRRCRSLSRLAVSSPLPLPKPARSHRGRAGAGHCRPGELPALRSYQASNPEVPSEDLRTVPALSASATVLSFMTFPADPDPSGRARRISTIYAAASLAHGPPSSLDGYEAGTCVDNPSLAI